MELTKVIWHTEDLELALDNRGIKSTQQNIDILLNDPHFVQTLKQQSLECGREILDELILLYQKKLIRDDSNTTSLWTYGTETKHLKFQANDVWLEDIVVTLGFSDLSEFATDYSYHDSKKVFTLAQKDTKSGLMILGGDNEDEA
ncbi:hypothetical protein ACJGE4_20640 (plasmid) [Bacillus velezensis]|uniref:hypothetical protein n=1 Tax=Bacillaceae TaxID=186817 RepID=UPI0006A7FA06|nr:MULTISPECIES: hypothetical protein [Bacillaceae]QWQ49658.1 hypothetical protein KOM03_19865 [Bacillus velezensis]QWQ49714.1 hypothetical protein KOM03_20255 [Bacillus velezensis]QYC35373.1 hypothetical protein J5X95_20315 [Bacillus amyloliquefaciens]CUB43974.1 hypothetical protein BN2127_JRS8_02720 [Bacillus amyloliquefaciens]